MSSGNVMRLARGLHFPAHWLRLPRRTARLRLTFFYSSLFLVSGVVLLGITYLLVERATSTYVLPNGQGGLTLNGATTGVSTDPTIVSPSGKRPTAAQLHRLEQLQAVAVSQHQSDLHQLLLQSAVGLGAMAVLAVALGWLVAGRVLRPVRTLTSTARRISASNLHERLALQGPDDEFKELGDTLNDLFGRLDASFSSQHRFVANAAHELRTPLSVDRTLLQVALANRGADAETLRSTCEALLASNEDLVRLVDALLTLATSERGLERWEPVDLSVVAGEVLVERSTFSREDVEVRAVLEPASLAGDPDLLRRLITNLLDNAVRYNWSNGWVELVTGTRGGSATVMVSNTGPQVPAGDVERLFKPFERATQERSHQPRGDGARPLDSQCHSR